MKKIFAIIIIICIISIGMNIIRHIIYDDNEYVSGFEKIVEMSYIEYNRSETDNERNEVMKYIVTVYPEADPNDIEDELLKTFYIMCLNEVIK